MKYCVVFKVQVEASSPEEAQVLADEQLDEADIEVFEAGTENT